MGIYAYFFPSNNFFKTPKCINCSEILLITKLDIINMTLDIKCDNCFEIDKKNFSFSDFLKNGYISKNVSDINLKCETHDKPYAYFVKLVVSDIIVKIVVKKQNIQNINFLT